MGAVREVAKVGGRGPDHIGKVIPCSGSGGANIWVLNLGADGSNDAKARGRTCDITAAYDREEFVKARGRDLT